MGPETWEFMQSGGARGLNPLGSWHSTTYGCREGWSSDTRTSAYVGDCHFGNSHHARPYTQEYTTNSARSGYKFGTDPNMWNFWHLTIGCYTGIYTTRGSGNCL